MYRSTLSLCWLTENFFGDQCVIIPWWLLAGPFQCYDNLIYFQILLIVNVASECGYTDQHYRELVQLQSKLSNDDFSVLAFPCNQFGNQEPLRNSGIARFVKNTYNVNFPVFSKVKVKGDQAHPLYKYLYQNGQKEPEWNFGKYLVSKSGRVIQYWNQEVSPSSIRHFIEKHVKMAITDQYEVYRVKDLWC